MVNQNASLFLIASKKYGETNKMHVCLKKSCFVSLYLHCKYLDMCRSKVKNKHNQNMLIWCCNEAGHDIKDIKLLLSPGFMRHQNLTGGWSLQHWSLAAERWILIFCEICSIAMLSKASSTWVHELLSKMSVVCPSLVGRHFKPREFQDVINKAKT